MTLALHLNDDPIEVAEKFCQAHYVSEVKCSALQKILVGAKAAVQTYLYTGVPELPADKRKSDPWSEERLRYPYMPDQMLCLFICAFGFRSGSARGTHECRAFNAKQDSSLTARPQPRPASPSEIARYLHAAVTHDVHVLKHYTPDSVMVVVGLRDGRVSSSRLSVKTAPK